MPTIQMVLRSFLAFILVGAGVLIICWLGSRERHFNPPTQPDRIASSEGTFDSMKLEDESTKLEEERTRKLLEDLKQVIRVQSGDVRLLNERRHNKGSSSSSPTMP